MTRDTLLLVQRSTDDRSVATTHAQRLRERGVADAVRVGTYESEPARELREVVDDVTGDRLFVVPLSVSHTRETIDGVPAALARTDRPTHYCEPAGGHPAVTDALADRAAEQVDPSPAATLVLVGFGASGTPHNRRTVENHASRARERTDFGDVVTCYLLQNPAVECVRYNVSDGPAVAVPAFAAPNHVTEEEIPAKLELDRGGIAYADPLGTHPRVTDAVEASVARRRVVAPDPGGRPASFEDSLARSARPLATDGEG